eukprot:gene27943-36809_t
MPLIIIAGGPCVGKSTFAKILEEGLREHHGSVSVVSEESAGILKGSGYSDSQTEKAVRGSLKSAVDRRLSADSVVVLDSLNYIKGFRYELYCSARTFRTPHCVVWVAAGDGLADQWNSDRIRGGADAYSPQINRWDCPLFKVHMGRSQLSAAPTPPANLTGDPGTTAGSSGAKSEALLPPPKAGLVKSSFKRAAALPAAPSPAPAPAFAPPPVPVGEASPSACPGPSSSSSSSVSFSGTTAAARDVDADPSFQSPEAVVLSICAHFFSGAPAPAPPNASTAPLQKGDAALLYELDRTSMRILQWLTGLASGIWSGTGAAAAGAAEGRIRLVELQRHRQQFLKLNSQHPPASSAEVGSLFIDFLAGQL